MKSAALIFFLVFAALANCQNVTRPPFITYFAVVRDFSLTHADFQDANGAETGIPTLDISFDRKPTYCCANSTTSKTHGVEHYEEWYRDLPGVNIRFPISLNLVPLAGFDGVYYVDIPDFYPADLRGYGQEGIVNSYGDGEHNYLFTMEIHNNFYYRGGEVFTFSGDDDVWVYINGKRVIDLGGVHGRLTASVSLDTIAASIGITTNNSYPLDFFFAERHCCKSTFRIETSILPENDPPVALDKTINGVEGVPLSDYMDAFDRNGDALTYHIVTRTSHGLVTQAGNSSAFNYTSLANYYGQDSFTFFVFDGKFYSNTATVYIILQNVNDPPVASDLAVTTKGGTPIAGFLPSMDPDGDILTHTILTNPTSGTVELADARNGIFIYRPAETGVFTFTYKCNDGLLDSNTATVTVTVETGGVDLGTGGIVGVALGGAAVAGIATAAIYIFVVRARLKRAEADLEEQFNNGSIVNNPLFQEALGSVNPLYEDSGNSTVS